VKRAVTLGLLTVFCIAESGRGHEVIPAHECVAPGKPPDKSDSVRWNAFVDQVDAYRACMTSFIETSHAAADRHRAAANGATEEWNTFVRGSLNVPEVYPWPMPD